MKQQVLFFSLLICSIFSFGQVPDYFSNNPVWNEGAWISPEFVPDPAGLGWIEDISYYTAEELVLGSYTYYLIRMKRKKTPAIPSGPDDFEVFFTDQLYVRQEGRSVYFLTEGVDSLFISYELEVGDPITGHFGHINPGLTVQSIDSVLVGGVYRKIFFTETEEATFPETNLIEGIGHSSGVSDNGGYFANAHGYGDYWDLGASYTLGCYGENTEIKWPEGVPADYCNAGVSGLESFTQEKAIELYPNPAESNLNWKSENQLTSIKIVSIEGKTVMNQTIETGQFQVDISLLKPGIYIIQTTDLNGVISQNKIQKL